MINENENDRFYSSRKKCCEEAYRSVSDIQLLLEVSENMNYSIDVMDELRKVIRHQVDLLSLIADKLGMLDTLSLYHSRLHNLEDNNCNNHSKTSQY
jgi:hypothetical protein